MNKVIILRRKNMKIHTPNFKLSIEMYQQITDLFSKYKLIMLIRIDLVRTHNLNYS